MVKNKTNSAPAIGQKRGKQTPRNSVSAAGVKRNRADRKARPPQKQYRHGPEQPRSQQNKTAADTRDPNPVQGETASVV
jgi:hypothetical protein